MSARLNGLNAGAGGIVFPDMEDANPLQALSDRAGPKSESRENVVERTWQQSIYDFGEHSPGPRVQ
jgi:hypothetical protein